MLKVLLADDECKVLRHLQNSVPWAKLGLEVIGTVQTGLEALKFARQKSIDIIITDIQMPGMDGLTLCQKLREQNPRIQIIILSGYQDFFYAKKAIELQVLGYCLKPIDINDLSCLLHTAVRNTLQNKINNCDSLLDLIECGGSSEILDAFSELGICASKIYVAASVGVHNIEKPLQAQISHKLGKHKYLYFSSNPFDRTAAERIIAYTGSHGGIGIFPHSVSPEVLKDTIEDVLVMTYQFFITGKATLCDSLVNGPLTDDAFTALENAWQSPDQLKTLLEEFSRANCSLIFNIQTAFIFCNRVGICPAFGGSGDHGELMLYGFEQLPADYENFSELLLAFASEIHPALGQHSDVPTTSGSASFLAILKHLEENYEKDLSLKKIASQFHLNASYISQLIRSETGLTYTQYITELRINKAKELLKTSTLSLAEISDAVGFNDYFYFIKKFKKEVGVTPGKYIP